MSQLFTTFESVSPPDIIVPYNSKVDWSFLEQPEEQEEQDPNIDWSFLEQPENDYQLSPYISTIKPPSDIKSSSLAYDVISQARKLIGKKYSWGGSSLNSGFDCSGFIKYIFGKVGINLPRTAAEQGKIGEEISLQQAEPGDIIWFGSKNSPSGQHIGLISKIDNGQIYIIDAAGKKLGVVERQLPNLQIKSVRRINDISDFNQYVLDFFQNKGLTEQQARGILGNLIQESKGNHKAINKTSGAYGLAQWLGPRKQKLVQRYGNNPTLQQQLQFIWDELNTTENKAFQNLLSTNTVADATKVFAKDFERAGKNEMNMNKRIEFAYQT